MLLGGPLVTNGVLARAGDPEPIGHDPGFTRLDQVAPSLLKLLRGRLAVRPSSVRRTGAPALSPAPPPELPRVSRPLVPADSRRRRRKVVEIG